MKVIDNRITNDDAINIFDFNIDINGLQSLINVTQCKVHTFETGSVGIADCTVTNCVSTNCKITQCTTVQCNRINCINTNCTTIHCNEVECPTYVANDNHHCKPSTQCRDCYQCNTVECYLVKWDDECSDDGGGGD